MSRISIVVNTLNEEENLNRCLSSAKLLGDEIVIVDMKSKDKTLEIAKKFTDKIFIHPQVGFVEPARNFAIEKATGDWIFILDADEEIPQTLVLKLKEIVEIGEYDYVRIPRKNIIFGKWIKHTGWWPDYLIRFFKKGRVIWKEEIHSIPLVKGMGFDLPAEEENAIIHYHYQSISQFIERLNRYTDQEAGQLVDKGYKFNWQDLIKKPLDEFFSRFFAWEGYKDDLHGFTLSLLQAFSFLITYLKVWEKEKFPQEENVLVKTGEEIRKKVHEFNFWFWQKRAKEEKNLWLKNIFKLASKIKL